MSDARQGSAADRLGGRTFAFACRIVRFCTALDAAQGVPRRLGAQLLDAGTSVAANYTEAVASSSRRDFLARQKIVLREARESLLWLCLIEQCFPEWAEPSRDLAQEAHELVAIFTASTRRLSQSLAPPR
jgi:four helix bundle protein